MSILRLLPLFLTCLFWLQLAQPTAAQKPLLTQPAPDPAAPPWAVLLEAEDIALFELDELVATWAMDPAQRQETWLRFYQKWRRSVATFISSEGFVRIPDAADWRQVMDTLRQKRSSADSRQAGGWTSLGPFETINDARDGNQTPVSWQVNVYCLDQSLSHPDILYCGTEGSEIYKSTDRGMHWVPASRELAIHAVTAIAIHPTDPDIVYAGARMGLYRTTDGGVTWVHVLMHTNLNANAMVILPSDPNILLAAGASGLWRSIDGGNTWQQLMTEACYDLALKPDEPGTVYVLRNNAGDRRCEFWKSTDAGATFTIRQQGWFDGQDPARQDGGARMTVTPADPGRIYAVLIGQAKEGDNGFIGVYRSDDAGETWTLPNPPAGGPYAANHPNLAVINPFSGTGFHQGFYNLSIGASHSDADQVLVGHLSLWRSTNGGAAFDLMGGYGGSLQWIHPDIQWIHNRGDETWVATDGGINYSTDFFDTHQSRKRGITGSDYWGFGQGWNEDIMVGGRYHNGNSGWLETYPEGLHLRLGGAEEATGYVSPGPERKTYFSDIGGRILPGQIELPSTNFPVSRWPNELYFAAESSDQVWAPDCYNAYITGSDNGLWATEDGGASFTLIHAFDQTGGGRITQIAQCRTAPEVIYIAQRNAATWSEGWVWRTRDGGANWQALTLPQGYKRRFILSVDPEDPDYLALGYTDGANGEKLFLSIDGGDNWINITSALLDGERPQSLVVLGGTGGSLLLGTDHSVYYRASDVGDWTWYGDGLPAQIQCNILRPFYRDGKVRLGAYGKGIWEAPLPADFVPVVQAMADKRVAFCIRDTFTFDDHSILRHDGVQWSWSFPGGIPTTSSLRHPKVHYPQAGHYTASLEVSGPFGLRTSAIPVEVRDECSPEGVPGLALRLENNGDAATLSSGTDQVHSHLTFSAWVKPEGIQSSYAGIVIGTFEGNAFGINVRDDNRLGYHWPGGAWWWDSGMDLIPGQWQHVAIVVQPGSVTLYLNGVPAVHNTNAQPIALTDMHIGRYRDWNNRTWRGWIDEVCLWQKALNTAEIRLNMHLTRDAVNDPDLIAYYQFNRQSGVETDRIGTRHLALSGGAHRVPSTAPIGQGVSGMIEISTPGFYNLQAPHLELTFEQGTALPVGPLVFSQLFVLPDTPPNTPEPSSPHYWIVHHFGPEGADPISTLGLGNPGPIWPANVVDPASLVLWERPWYAEGVTWVQETAAVDVALGPQPMAQFRDLGFPAQWILTNDADTTLTMVRPELPQTEQTAVLQPNPIRSGVPVTLFATVAEACEVSLFDSRGLPLYRGVIYPGQTLPNTAWPAGVLLYQIKQGERLWRGKLIVSQ
jgi:photosystem II stability/assembly factor-like uncharacterized protein